MRRASIYLATIISAAAAAHGELVISDNYNVSGAGSGFGVNTGVNSGLDTRLNGSAADGLSYYFAGGSRAGSFFSINNNKLQVDADNSIARFTFSNTGTNAFDFGTALGTSLATAVSPLTYDVKISMANNENSNQRFSFGISTVNNDVTFWDLGIQLARNTTTGNRYTIYKRIDTASAGVADVNAAITTLGANTFGTEINFLLRITDAGAESGSSYNSRVQISLDGGSSFIYDTASDTDLPNKFRFDSAERYFLFDIAGGSGVTGYVTYDNFSVTSVPEPSVSALLGLSGVGLCWFYRRRKS